MRRCRQAGRWGGSFGEGVSEPRIDYGPGYRVYFVQRGSVLIVLLCGGDERTQARDIKVAKALLDDLKDIENADQDPLV